MKKFVSAAIAAMLALNSLLPVCAADTQSVSVDTDTDIVVDMQISAATFSITAPTTLPVAIDADGVSSVAANCKIVNNCRGPVVVNSAKLIPDNGWTLKKWDSDWSKTKTGTKEFAMSIMGEGVAANGRIDVSLFGQIAGGSSLPIEYDARAAVQSHAISTSPAKLVIVIGWDSVDADLSGDEEENEPSDDDEDEEPAETISFMIDGKSYTAEKGKSWSDWVNSVYNTDGYRYEYTRGFLGNTLITASSTPLTGECKTLAFNPLDSGTVIDFDGGPAESAAYLFYTWDEGIYLGLDE